MTLTQPADGTLYDAGADISLAATATDSDGTVVQVEFFVDGVSLGIDSAAPYEMTYADVPQGIYEFHAVATDELGASRRSATVQVFVGDVCTSPPWTRRRSTGAATSVRTADTSGAPNGGPSR